MIVQNHPVGWATYVQEVRYVAGAWMRKSDPLPTAQMSDMEAIPDAGAAGRFEMVGNIVAHPTETLS
jgi:hypothetical protein